jgi:hypothetical protein
MVLDANGEVTFYIDGDTDLVLDDADDVQLWGPIRATDSSKNTTLTGVTLAGSLTVTSTAVTWSGNPTHSGNHTFANNVTVNGNVVLGDASTDTLVVNGDTLSIPNDLHVSGGEFTFDPPVGSENSPVLSFGGASVGITYTVDREVRYWEMGGLAFFMVRMIITNKGSSTGTAAITGLPFTPDGSGLGGLSEFPCSVRATGLTGLTGVLSASVTSGSTTLTLKQTDATGMAVNLTDANFTNATDIHVCGFCPI